MSKHKLGIYIVKKLRHIKKENSGCHEKGRKIRGNKVLLGNRDIWMDGLNVSRSYKLKMETGMRVG